MNSLIMVNEELKLISARLDKETLAKIDAFVLKHTYWKRNTVINMILKAVMSDFDERDIYDMVRRNHFKSQSVRCCYMIE